MREYWINVYDHGLGYFHNFKDDAIVIGEVTIVTNGWKLLYRIHVRLK